jgi:hypothetical protein
MARLLGDAPLRDQFARAGRRTIEQNYSFTRRMEKMRNVYDMVLNGRADDACQSESLTENAYASR